MKFKCISNVFHMYLKCISDVFQMYFERQLKMKCDSHHLWLLISSVNCIPCQMEIISKCIYWSWSPFIEPDIIITQSACISNRSALIGFMDNGIYGAQVHTPEKWYICTQLAGVRYLYKVNIEQGYICTHFTRSDRYLYTMHFRHGGHLCAASTFAPTTLCPVCVGSWSR